MGNAKPWQIAVVVGGFLIGLGLIVWQLTRGDGVDLAGRVVMADLSTGELFEFSTKSKSAIIPEKNPNTGKYNLIPVERTPDGKWRVRRRYTDSVSQIEGKPDALLSTESGEVKVVDSSPRSVSR
ncbi:MAG: hypothetical protein SFY96_11980 [Planctomycetota bacterium]|nr:hypothetical protein [Planctomycetota bacterium]